MDSLRDVSRMERDFCSLTSDHLKYLKNDYKERLKKMKKCILENQLFLLQTSEKYRDMFNYTQLPNGQFQIGKLQI